MRAVKMQGGMGNQLFCLAFAHRVARITGEPVAVDLASFEVGHYGYTFELLGLAERLGIGLAHKPLLSSRLVTAVMRLAPFGGYVSEGAPPTSQTALRALTGRVRYFNGYWQHERYFEPDFRERVRDFVFEQADVELAHAVVVHCRTYKEEVRPARRAVPSPAWFGRCFKRLAELGIDLSDVALISDDPELARSRMGEAGARVFPVIGGNAWTDMALLLRAQALVLTNSTFSWWGGYCGEATTILYPAKGDLFHYAAPAARFTVVD